MQLNPQYKKKAGVGFQFGVSSNYHFGNSFSLNPGIRFRQNRFSATEGDGSYSTETEYKYNFISTPILANFRLGPKVNFAIGPELNYLLSATSKISSGSYGGETEKITERSTRLGLGLESSLSVRVSKRLGFGLSINKGLNNLDKKTESDYGSYEGNIKSMTHFSLTIDYLLCLMETAEWLRNRK